MAFTCEIPHNPFLPSPISLIHQTTKRQTLASFNKIILSACPYSLFAMSTAAQDEFYALASREKEHFTHPEDAIILDISSESASEHEPIPSDSSDDDNKPNRGRVRAAPTDMYHIPRGTHFDANTGPKGVIADAKSFDQARKRTFRQTIYDVLSTGTTNNIFEKRRTNSSQSREKSSSPDLSASDDDENFMKIWRQDRIHEMQNGAQGNRNRRLSPSQRRYGRLIRVDANGYLDAVEKVAPNTTVVVCIYDEDVCINDTK